MSSGPEPSNDQDGKGGGGQPWRGFVRSVKRLIGISLHAAEKLMRRIKRGLLYRIVRWTRLTLFVFFTALAIPFLLTAAILGIIGSAFMDLGAELERGTSFLRRQRPPEEL